VAFRRSDPIRCRVPDPLQPPARQPIFNIPPATAALLIACVAVHLVRLLAPRDVDQALIFTFGFIPARYTLVSLDWPAIVDPVTYQFLHLNLAHLAANMLALLAFGSGVERRIGVGRMLIFAILCGIAGAAAHLVAYPYSVQPVVGASAAISGLFAGVLRFRVRTRAGHRAGLWPLIGLWVVMNVISGVTGMPGAQGVAIAWVAHFGGFVAGLLLFGMFDRSVAGRR
jgi:membrane associated rhomboid family serine protease